MLTHIRIKDAVFCRKSILYAGKADDGVRVEFGDDRVAAVPGTEEEIDAFLSELAETDDSTYLYMQTSKGLRG